MDFFLCLLLSISTYNPGQKLLGRLRASLHFVPNSICSNYWVYYLGNTMLFWAPLPPSPIFNVGVLHARKVTIFFLEMLEFFMQEKSPFSSWKLQH